MRDMKKPKQSGFFFFGLNPGFVFFLFSSEASCGCARTSTSLIFPSCCSWSNQKMSLSTSYLARIELWSLRNATDMLYDMGTAGRRIVAHSLEDEPTSKLLHTALVVCILGYKERPAYSGRVFKKRRREKKIQCFFCKCFFWICLSCAR